MFFNFHQSASPEQRVFVSEKQRAHLAAVTIQRWWARAGSERLRWLGAEAAATLLQATWRGRAGRIAVAALVLKREEEHHVAEVIFFLFFSRMAENEGDRGRGKDEIRNGVARCVALLCSIFYHDRLFVEAEEVEWLPTALHPSSFLWVT